MAIGVMTAISDLEFIERHRTIWTARPELRSVYHDFFDQLIKEVGDRSPVVELGTGPGFFKEYHPELIATDVISTRWVEAVCDGCALPFPAESVGAIVMLDVLHHLPRPLDFISEAARVLRPGGVVAMIEPWITPISYLLYRFLHHEDCTLRLDIESPFRSSQKDAFTGNATIPFNLVRHYSRVSSPPMRLITLKPFLGLSYLATLGFKRSAPLPQSLINAARRCERALGLVGRLSSTRALLVWEKLP
jgi:SAM-dependent methyltransferase